MMLWLKNAARASTALCLLSALAVGATAGCKGNSEVGGSTDSAAAATTNTMTNTPAPATDTNATQTATNSTSQ